jgi:hypothetical protein
MLVGKSSSGEIETALDAILRASSEDGASTELSLREGRRLWVRRVSFTREVSKDGGAGAFVLELDAPDPAEESSTIRVFDWTITGDGSLLAIPGGGTFYSQPVISLTPEESVASPSIGDGTRTMTYEGMVGAGVTLLFDGAAGMVSLNGTDVTAYSSGMFPRVGPNDGVLSYSDATEASKRVTALVTVRDRWW